MPVAYVIGTSMFILTTGDTVPIIRDANFDPKGHVYQQLTPDGTLP